MNKRQPGTRNASGRYRALKRLLSQWAPSATALTLVLGVAAGSTTIALMQSAKSGNTPTVAAALTVTQVQARSAQWPVTIDAFGVIAPWEEAVISAQVAGLRLTELKVNVGDIVKRGQVLARYDRDLLLADASQLRAAMHQADTNYQRALGLKGSGGISEQDLLQYQTQAETAHAQLDSKNLQLRYADVIAPDDGIISARSATVGAVASSGQELFRMIRQRRLEWRGELSALQLRQIGVHQSLTLNLPDGTMAQATVRQSSPVIDSQTRLGMVYADIAPGSTARAGMYASGHILLASATALEIPAASVVIRDGRSYVLKFSRTQNAKDSAAVSKVILQPVQTGRRQNTRIEIVDGLHEGEYVVEQGAGFLNDGDAVKIVQAGNPS